MVHSSIDSPAVPHTSNDHVAILHKVDRTPVSLAHTIPACLTRQRLHTWLRCEWIFCDTFQPAAKPSCNVARYGFQLFEGLWPDDQRHDPHSLSASSLSRPRIVCTAAVDQ